MRKVKCINSPTFFTNFANDNDSIPYFVRSVQMRLYSMHKREFGLVFLAFFACFGMCVFIGLAGRATQ